MIKINYKSDFKINESSETVAMEVPFVFSYYVFDRKKYVVSFDGHNYVNCERKEDGSLDVIFNQPEFGIGHLKVERKYAIDDKAFADGVFDVVTVDKTDVFITSGQTFETYVKTLVVPPYIKGDKGDPMTWETMTEKERGELVKDVAEAIDPEMVMTENEKSRQEAERSRQTAEQQRSTTFNTLKGEMQSAITAGNEAAGNAKKVVDEYDTKVAEQDSKLTELGSEVKLIQDAVYSVEMAIVLNKSGETISEKVGFLKKGGVIQFSSNNVYSTLILKKDNGEELVVWDEKTNQNTEIVLADDYDSIYIWHTTSNSNELTVSVKKKSMTERERDIEDKLVDLDLLAESVYSINQNVYLGNAGETKTLRVGFLKKGEVIRFSSNNVYSTLKLQNENEEELVVWNEKTNQQVELELDKDYKYIYIWHTTSNNDNLIVSVSKDSVTDRFSSFQKTTNHRLEYIDDVVRNFDSTPRAFTISKSTNLSNVKLYKGRTYRLYKDELKAKGIFTIRLGRDSEYNANNSVPLISDASLCNIVFTAPEDYNSIRIYCDSGTEETFFLYSEETVEELNLVNINWSNGKFYANGEVPTSTSDGIRTQKIQGEGLLLFTFPDSMYATYNCKDKFSGNRANYTIQHPFSLKVDRTDFARVYFQYKDGRDMNIETVSEEDLSAIKVYRISTKSNEYDITVAASNSSDIDKSKADIVFDGYNDNEILAACVGCHNSIKIKLYGGDYRLTEFYTWGSCKCSLPLNTSSFNGRELIGNRTISIDGAITSIPQSELSTRFIVSDILYNKIDQTDIYNHFIIAAPYNFNEGKEVAISRAPIKFNAKDINVVGYYMDKAITYIDTTRCLSTALVSVNVRSWHEGIFTYNALPIMPNSECTGIRVGRGSNHGIQNLIKNSNVWYCGKGVVVNGEHYIIEDVKSHHCYIGFYLGDKYTVGAVEHPNIMIGCAVEGCYRLMVLTKMGIDYQCQFEDVSNREGVSASSLIIIGLSTERKWTIPATTEKQDTLPILELVNGAYLGRIELDWDGNPFEKGSGKNLKYTAYRLYNPTVFEGTGNE